MCEYDAITVDTNIFEKENYNLENGILATFEQFATIDGIDFILSEIVYNEIISHMEKNTLSALSDYIKVLKNSYFYKLDDSVTLDKIKDIKAVNVQNVVKARIDEYQRKTNFELIPVDGVDAKEVVKAYFEKKPPFSEKKKEEFPDAFALQSLANWANTDSKKILLISQDKDWLLFCNTNPNMVCVKTIEDAFSILFENKGVALQLLKNIFSNVYKQDSLYLLIDGTLMEIADRISVELNITSCYECEENYFEAGYVDISEFYYEEIEIVKYDKDNNSYTISIPVSLTYYIEADYSFYVKDEDDYIHLGNNSISKEMYFKTNLLITLQPNITSIKESEIIDVDFKNYILTKNLHLEPDFTQDYSKEYIEKEPEDIRHV